MLHQKRPSFVETQKGHLNRLRKNLRSSNRYSVLEVEDVDTQVAPDLNDPISSVDDSDPAPTEPSDPVAPFVLYTKFIDLNDLTPADRDLFSLHSDATGKYPFESFSRNNYVLVSVYPN